MTSEFPAQFACNYHCLLNRLKLHGMQPKTIALYSHGARRARGYFDYRIDDLTRLQLTDYFVHVVNSLSWSSLKHDLYGLKFYYAQVLNNTLAGRRFGQTAQVIQTAGYYYRAAAPTNIHGHAGAQLSRVFLYPVQPGVTAGRRIAFANRGH